MSKKVDVNDIDKAINDLCDQFSATIGKLLTLVETKSKDPDIDRLKRLIKICKEEDPTFLIERCQNKLWESRDQIKTRNSDYFMKQLDVSKYIRAGSQSEAFQYRLIASVKKEYTNLTVAEENEIWTITYDMLKCAARYKFLTKNYSPDGEKKDEKQTA